MSKTNIIKVLSVALGTMSLVLLGGVFEETSAQTKDPFNKNPIILKKERRKNKPRSVKSSGSSKTKKKSGKKGPNIVEAPSTEARINYYKQVRQIAAENGEPIPKPTSVLLLDELSVSGIFKTPRGYAAIVKASQIGLSFTIYPGEKFFDGQLVAVEENRLIFRKITKWSTGKFVSSVENKTLRTYSDQQTFQGTAPVRSYTGSLESAKNDSSKKSGDKKADSGKIKSPLEEAKQNSNKATDTKSNSKDKKGKPRAKKKG